MDLKIQDVAELLNVSETTIRRWVKDGKIPAYKLNHQFRFSKIEIEEWVFSQKLGKGDRISPFQETKPAGSQQYSFYRAITKGGIYTDVPGATKEEVIRNAVKQIAQHLKLDAHIITELLLDRELLMPTALGNGLAVPHSRDCFSSLHQDSIAVVFPENPIEYGALDDTPVHALFFMFASDDKRHLHLLAKLAHFGKQEKFLSLLKTKPEKQELLGYIKEREAELS